MVLLDRMVWLVNAGVLRDLVLAEVIAAHQLVGGVTAHQGNDG
jgi:hypothetical protein